jgi:translation elongation factor EF-1alpha
MADKDFLIFFLDNADIYGMLVEKKERKTMIGTVVECVVKNANGNHLVSGEIIRQCDNPNVYVLKLSHMVDCLDDRKYIYPADTTILVLDSEIVQVDA